MIWLEVPIWIYTASANSHFSVTERPGIPTGSDGCFHFTTFQKNTRIKKHSRRTDGASCACWVPAGSLLSCTTFMTCSPRPRDTRSLRSGATTKRLKLKTERPPYSCGLCAGRMRVVYCRKSGYLKWPLQLIFYWAKVLNKVLIFA